MATLDDHKLLDPKRIRELLITAYNEGREHERSAWKDRHGGAGPQFEDGMTAIWVDLYETVMPLPVPEGKR